MTAARALVLWGGYPDHQPREAVERFIPFLKSTGSEVVVSDTPGALGIAGLHSATDAAYQWPAIGSLLGGRFNGHPITGDLPITVVDRSHPATAHLPSPWVFRDELYLFRELVPDARLLLAVEFGGSDVGTLPIAWCVERPPVRTFYTALGHFVAAYENADYLRHVLGGVRWVLDNGRGRPSASRAARKAPPPA